MGPYVKLIWLLVISILLLGVSVVWFYKEFNPEWKQCQRAEVQENEALKGKKLEIKQILLKGEGLWSNQESGQRVDRCMTCHIDEEKLVKLHPKNFLSLMMFMDVQYVMVEMAGLLSRNVRMSICMRIGMRWKRAVILPMSL